MKRILESQLLLAMMLIVLFLLVSPASKSQAAITATGDVLPTDPNTWTDKTPAYIGKTSVGTLTVDAGSYLSSSDGSLGVDVDAEGTVTITGTGSIWYNYPALYVGVYGKGTLNIAAGGAVYNSIGYIGYKAGSTGSVAITGTNSKWTSSNILYNGYSGKGTITIEAGALVSDSVGFLGYNSGSDGFITITGSGSKWTNSGNLNNGYSGTGTLNIKDGASVSNSVGYLGVQSGSNGSVTITGSGSKWTNSSYLYCGYSGVGTLKLEDGALVSNSSGYLGYYPGSTGTAKITGVGSKWSNSSSLYIGLSGSGSLDIEAGGEVSNLSGSIGSYYGSIGVVNVVGSGSKWTNNGDLSVGGYGSGKLTVNNGGTVIVNGTLFTSLTSLYGDGIISTNGALLDGDIVFDASHGLQQIINFGTGGKIYLNQNRYTTLGVGYVNNGTLRIAEGMAVVSNNGYLGFHSGSVGIATVTGEGSTWTISDSLLGGSGSRLKIEMGGQVSSNYVSLSGNATITGSGSKWNASRQLDISGSDIAMLSVEAGGCVSSSVGQLGGYQVGSYGTARITGEGSKWTNSNDLRIGLSGNGTLYIEAGGQVSNSEGRLGIFSGSTGMVTVTGSGSKWINNYLEIGESGSGTLNIQSGGQVSCSASTLGFESGSVGTVKVSGTGSKLINSAGLNIGSSGSGTLIIEAGGQVSNTQGIIGFGPGSTGRAIVTGAGSEWINTADLFINSSNNGILTVTEGGSVFVSGSLWASLNNLDGNGTITTNGIVLDADIIFDDSHGLQQTITFGTGGNLCFNQNANTTLGAGINKNGTITIAQGMTVFSSQGKLGYHSGAFGTATIRGPDSKWINSNNLSIGFLGRGEMKIEEGGQVSNSYGSLGNARGSSGTATITGTGSKWNNNASLYVGNSGKGSMMITDGGQVSASESYLGYSSGITGIATVSGSGSKWTNTFNLTIGYSGQGILYIVEGGAVNANNVSINNQSLLTIDVLRGSKLSISSGSLTNNGNVRVLAGASPAANMIYSPIAATTWSGSGVYQAVGGTWNATTHVFTVSDVQPGDSGTALTIDRLNTQRVLIGDSGSGWRLGASFLAATASTPMSFTATAISDGTLDALRGTIGTGDVLLGGWNLAAASGYKAGDPVYLSFGDGVSGYADENMKLWSYDGTKWSDITPDDLTFDGDYANFTTTALGCFAVTVPEPSMGVLLGIFVSGLAMVARYRRGR